MGACCLRPKIREKIRERHIVGNKNIFDIAGLEVNELKSCINKSNLVGLFIVARQILVDV